MAYKTVLKTTKVRKPHKTIQTKGITGIIKKVIRGESETKSAVSTASLNNFDGLVYAFNLNYFLPQGSTSEQLVGEKLLLNSIYVKGEAFHINSASASNQPMAYRVLLIKTKKPLTNTSGSITATDVFRAGTASRYSTNGMVDLHKVDLLHDQTMFFGQPNQVNTDQFRPFTINKKIGKTHYTDADNSGYFKDKNYYLICVCDKNTSQAANTGFIRFSWALNFKDI